MSAPREELHHLVDDLPEDMVPAVLAELRARVAQSSDRPWPPAWFGAATASRPDISDRVDEILGDELGQRPA